MLLEEQCLLGSADGPDATECEGRLHEREGAIRQLEQASR